MKLTKEQCIEAIKKEPLHPGRYFMDEGLDCEVCAVGAIIRNTLDESFHNTFTGLVVTQGDCVAFHINEIDIALRRKNYLGAVSMAFEHFCEEFSREEGHPTHDELELIRAETINFIEEFIPDKFEIELPEV
jgi:hypothetical protein